MTKNRRANAVVFGFDFQVNAAIVLMLENIMDLKALRLEGNFEDIELRLNDGQYILAQAKAIENSSSDFRNVRKNLKKALESLSDGSSKSKTKQLIFITNSPNPINDDASRSIFWGPAHREFKSLPQSSQNIICDYLSSVHQPLNTDKLTIQILPFETDDESERYKVVMQVIDNFVGELNLNIPGLGKKLLSIWHFDVFNNSTKKDATIELNKKDLMWPIMVIATNINQCDEEFLDRFEPGVYDEIVHLYSDTIESCCERCEFFIKVLCDYNDYPSPKKLSDKCLDFVDNKWSDYLDEFKVNGISAETQEGLAKIILYSIVRRRRVIDKIKQGVNL